MAARYSCGRSAISTSAGERPSAHSYSAPPIDDPGATSRYYARVLGRPGAPVQRADLEGAGVSFQIGPDELQLLASKSEAGPLAMWIRDRGQSPFEVVLANAGAVVTPLDPVLLQGARIRFA